MMNTVSNVLSLSRDLITTVRPEKILQGRKIFRPFRKFQDAWIDYVYPGESIDDNVSVWSHLQKYVVPLIKKHASLYHVQGMELLDLDQIEPPDFKQFQQKFETAARGFVIEPVTHEIAAREYFSLIQQRRFPCIERIRSHDELFCGNKPDFWHEAVGHLAPLCFPAVQEFYLRMADWMLADKSAAQFEEDLAVAWTLMEYGFLLQNGKPKMFGAALVGSHLAHVRYMRGMIGVEAADRSKIIRSGFYTRGGVLPRDRNGKIRFFCMDKLEVARVL